MKKVFVMILTVAMLLSLSAVCATAELSSNVSWSDGWYSVNPDEFFPIGDVKIQWDPEAASKLDFHDGVMDDWANAGYNNILVTAANMVAWGGNPENVVHSDWSINTYFVADSEWLYIGFFVSDDDFTYIPDANPKNYGAGDAFQVCIDFGGKLGEKIENDPTLMTNPKNIFYSFGCVADFEPIAIMRQESDNDKLLTEDNGDGVKGTAYKTAQGWSAEFALSWDMLYNDYAWKAFEEKDEKIFVGGENELPLKIGCCLYYFDRYTKEDGTTAANWNAGTTNGTKRDDGTPVLSWTAYDNGINLYLPYEEGMEIDCENIVIIDSSETVPPEINAPETEALETQAPETAVPETAVPETNAPNDETPTDEDAKVTGQVSDSTTPTGGNDQGCSSSIGLSFVAIMTAIGAVTVLKKKD